MRGFVANTDFEWFTFLREKRPEYLAVCFDSKGGTFRDDLYGEYKANRQETRLVLDLDTFEGYAFRGTVEEFAPHQNPVAYDRVCGGFTAGNWGRPSRVFRFVADQWTRLEAPKP